MRALSLLITALLGIASFSPSMNAEANKRQLTLAEYTAGSPKYIRPRSVPGLQWLGERLISLQEGHIAVQKIGDTAWTPLLSLEELKRMIPTEGKDLDLKRMPYYQVIPGNYLLFTMPGRSLIIDPLTKRLEADFQYPQNAEATQFNQAHTSLAYVAENNIYVINAAGHRQQVTTDGSEQLVYGQSVHQNEFGIKGGLFWSPDGKKLAFYRMDQSPVKPYPILHIAGQHPYSQMQYYPMAGTALHRVTLGVYDVTTGHTIYLQSPDPSKHYLTNISWTPQSDQILIAELNRAQTHMELKAYDALTGVFRYNIITEHNDIYTEPQHPALFLPHNPKQFIWQSRQDGYNHLYLYDTNGKLIRQLTQGAWEVTDVYGFSPDGQTLYYSSTEASPLERQLYSVTMRGKRQALTAQPGWHSIVFAPGKQAFIDIFEAQDVAREISVFNQKGKLLTTILPAQHPDTDYLVPSIEVGTLKAADQTTDLYYRLIKPHNFDPGKKYPVIVYVYNGPHAQLVQNRYRTGARGWELNMANEGYIIFTLDGRGSAARGAAFEQIIHRHLGKHEMADQLEGIKHLTALPYVDASRIGVYGWSYGGFMTTNLMLTHPEIFRVGVAGGPVMDWSRYEIMYGERYMDTPEENPTGYEANNLLLRAGHLKGRLLLIHGTVDPVVIWQHSLLFMQSAITAGSHPDYMVYPEHAHNVLGPDRLHLNETITRYFKDHL